ncbi:hypothetical protein ACFY3N_15425 [Streptomyces sp. NPDC000348]|uniref:hypothetical protein n=1 Tax=Streptomyces sp. NPDC000348 TaxID=3364538 RepID=UPI0036995B66
MRRTARALSLAAATGAALAALAPAVSAGTVPDDGASWGTASHAPCPEPEEPAWEPDAPEPAGSGAVVPKGTAPDGPDAGLDAGEGTGLDAGEGTGLDAGEGTGLDAGEGTGLDAGEGTGLDAEADTGLDTGPGSEAEIPAPEENGPAGPGAVGPKAPKPGPGGSRAPGPRPGEPTATPCPGAPAHHGVHAGGGGAFTDSVPALAAGGLLIAGAFGAAAHRVYRDRTTRADG